MQRLFEFCAALTERGAHFDLRVVRDSAVMVAVVVPGEYLEIEFFTDGSVEIERFVSQGVTSGSSADLQQVLAAFDT